MKLPLTYKYEDEAKADDSFDSDAGADSLSGEEGSAETPDYFIGELTQDQVLERLNSSADFPESMRGLESRVTAQVNPIMERLGALQEQLGTQQKFEPNLDRIKAVLSEYDPALAEKFLPALMEDLAGSMSSAPFDVEALAPHINPMLQQMQHDQMAMMVPALLDKLPFDAEAVVNRDPADGSKILEPSTDLQKEFKTWWDHLDAPTRAALGNYDIGYARAMHTFGKWRAGRLKGKGEAAGDASTRLSASRQIRTGGRRQQPQSRLETESDGFQSVFKETS